MLTLARKTRQSIYIYPDDLPPDMTVKELFSEGHVAFTV
jgi:hypothetical protein